MNEDVETLGAELAVLADAAAPAARLDVGWTIRQGRARLRRRRLSVLGAVTAVAVAASALALGPSGGVRPGAPVTPAAPASAPAGGTPVLLTDTGRDPLTVGATFGWLPEGFRVSVYHRQGDGVSSVSARGPVDGAVRRTLTLTSLLDERQLPAAADRVEAPPVRGLPAFWQGAGPDDATTLYWRTPDGTWVSAGELFTTGDDVKAVLHRIAEQAVVGRRAAALPLRFAGLPADTEFLDTSVFPADPSRAGRSWSVSLSMVVGGVGVTVAVGPAEPVPAAGVSYGVDSVHHGLPSGSPACKSRQGLDVCVLAGPGGEPAPAAAAVVAGLLAAIDLLGPDGAGWTADVLG